MARVRRGRGRRSGRDAIGSAPSRGSRTSFSTLPRIGAPSAFVPAKSYVSLSGAAFGAAVEIDSSVVKKAPIPAAWTMDATACGPAPSLASCGAGRPVTTEKLAETLSTSVAIATTRPSPSSGSTRSDEASGTKPERPTAAGSATCTFPHAGTGTSPRPSARPEASKSRRATRAPRPVVSARTTLHLTACVTFRPGRRSGHFPAPVPSPAATTGISAVNRPPVGEVPVTTLRIASAEELRTSRCAAPSASPKRTGSTSSRRTVPAAGILTPARTASRSPSDPERAA